MRGADNVIAPVVVTYHDPNRDRPEYEYAAVSVLLEEFGSRRSSTRCSTLDCGPIHVGVATARMSAIFTCPGFLV
jgi:hypothetical protein